MPRTPPLLIVTNRGPLVVDRASGTLVPAGGGVASGFLGLVTHEGAPGQEELPESRWCFPISSPAELEAHRQGAYERWSSRLRPIPVDPRDHQLAYGRIANEFLWYLVHGLFDAAFEPLYDQGFHDALEAYRRFNRSIAHAIAHEVGAGEAVLVNDYHLLLVPGLLRRQGFGGRIGLFLHTPWATEEEWRVVPAPLAREIATSVADADVVGVHAARWAARLVATLAPHLDPRCVVVAPLPLDAARLRADAAAPEVAEERARLEALTGGLPTIGRVDRLEPSKNLLRGVLAIDALLAREPALRGGIRALVCSYPSREGLRKYAAIRPALEELVAATNDRWRRPGWEPIHLEIEDRPFRSLALYQLLQVGLINPLRDGLNLVALEASLLARDRAGVVLSSEAGVAEHVGDAVELVAPFDVEGTADALARALQGGNLAPVRDWIEANTWFAWTRSMLGALG
jgi:trehalose 6-phosphate synthase